MIIIVVVIIIIVMANEGEVVWENGSIVIALF